MSPCIPRTALPFIAALTIVSALGACSSTTSDSGTPNPAAGGNSSGAAGADQLGTAGQSPSGGTTSGGTTSGNAGGSAVGPGGGGQSTSGTGGAGDNGGSGAGSNAAGTGGSAGDGNITGAAGSTAAGGATGSVPLTVWIAGDSTVATGGPCPIGWGGQFKPLFNDKVTVTNSAVAGRSVRTWLYNPETTMDATGECTLALGTDNMPTVQAHWTAMLNGMKAGDYLFIQFGINDSDATCPRHVGVDAFKTSYGVMAQAAKDRGAQPIFVTPTANIACNGSTVSTNTRQPYVTATKDAGTEFGVPVIDLNALSSALYSSLGFCPIPGGGDVSATTTGAVGAFFCDDHTHFDTPGAIQIAGLVAKALTTQGLGLAAYLK